MPVKTPLDCVMTRLTICILCMLGMKGVLDPNMELLLCSGAVLYCTVLLYVGPTSDRARCCSGERPPSSHSDSSLDSAILGRSIKGNTSIGVIFTLMTNSEKASSRGFSS